MNRRVGDSIGRAHITGFYRPDHALGVLVEIGDRVQVRNDQRGVPYAAWGTVEGLAGLGSTFVRLDDGRRFRFFTRYLQFAKLGRPALEPKP